MGCPHDVTERDVAATADGLCPLCLSAEIERLRDERNFNAERIDDLWAENDRLRAADSLTRAQVEIVKELTADVERLTAENDRLRAGLVTEVKRWQTNSERYWEARWRDEKRENDRLRELLRVLLDGDPNEDAADGVSVLEAWRKEVRAALVANA